MQAVTPVGSHPLASAESSKAWFRGLPSTDPKGAVDAVNGSLSTLSPAALAGAGALSTLEALETLRKPLVAASEDLASRYADKALPLSETQRAAFDSNITLAFTLAFFYHSLIKESLTPGSPLSPHAALIHQRAICWTAHAMVEHLRGRQRFADKDWDLAQDVLQSAGRHQMLETEVRDSLQPAGASSVAATYGRLLLLELAGARSLTAREFDCARELAYYFENKVELSYIVADSKGVIASLPKPDGDEPVKTLQTGGLLHFLDMGALSRSLGRRVESLNRGRMFDTPVLTTAAGVPSLKSLLAKLHSAWCSRSNQRQFPRRPHDEQVYCAFEPAAIYALMKRRPYTAPPPPKLYAHHEVASIYLDRDGAPPDAMRRADGVDAQQNWDEARARLEVWQSQEESANGMSLLRTRGGARMRQGQLIALRLGDTGAAMIGVVRWAEQEVSNAANASGEPGIDPGHTVEIGVQLLPGLARAGAVRQIGTAALVQTSGKPTSSAALILDHFSRGAPRAASGPNTIIPGAVPQRPLASDELPRIEIEEVEELQEVADPNGPYRYSERATIVLPSGWAREGETIEFIDGTTSFKLRLGKQTHRHGDFDRLHYTMTE